MFMKLADKNAYVQFKYKVLFWSLHNLILPFVLFDSFHDFTIILKCEKQQ